MSALVYGENVKPSDYDKPKKKRYEYTREQALSNQALNPNKDMGQSFSQATQSQTPQYTSEELQQMSVLYTGNKSTPAERAATTVQARMSFPGETRFIPSDRNIKVEVPPPVRVQRNTQKESDFAERVKTQIKRESDIQESYARTPFGALSKLLEPKPDENLSPMSFINQKYSFGVAKAAGKFVVDLPVSTYVLGGRAALFADTLREGVANKARRKEIGQELFVNAPSKVPKELANQFNPVKPSGLVNLGLAAFSIKEAGIARQAARQKTQISFAEIGGKRISSDGFILDEPLQFKVKAYQGKTPIEVTGKARAEFIDIDKGQAIAKASGELFGKGKKTEFELRGLTTKAEGGFDQFSVIKQVSKGKKEYFADITQTKEIISEPFGSFQQRSYTFKIPKGKPITQAKPLSASMGGFGELYVEDIFSGKNIFRKEVLSESGKPISTESYIGGSSTTATGMKPLNLRQEPIKARILEDLRTGKYADTGGNLKQKSVFRLKMKGGTEQAILTLAKEKALGIGKGIRTRQVLSQAGKASTLSLLSGRSVTSQKQASRPALRFKQFSFSTQSIGRSSLLSKKPTLDIRPISKQSSMNARPILTQKPILKASSKQILDVRQLYTYTPKFDIPFKPITGGSTGKLPPIILPPPMPSFSRGKASSFAFGSKGKKQYRFSLRGAFTKLKTPKLKTRQLTGFEARGR